MQAPSTSTAQGGDESMTDARLPGEGRGSGQDSTWSNPEKLSRKIRELASRSHRALREASRPVLAAHRSHTVEQDDLRDLREQVARLQEKVHQLRLGPLIPWVDALRKRVEEQFGREREGGSR
jgi:hypothetical protein